MKTTRIRNLIVAVLVGALGVSTVNAQDKSSAGSLVKPADAFARMSANKQARETEAYSLGVQTVLWGMQWVKAGQTPAGFLGGFA